MTVTGLATINLSSLTGFQQALLFMLMCMGSPVSVLVPCVLLYLANEEMKVIVSWVIVYTRRSVLD